MCTIKLSKWDENFCGNFWGSPNLSSYRDNNYIYVKHVSFKNINFGGYKMIKTAEYSKSLSDPLAPSKNCLRRWPAAALRGFCIYTWSANCLPDLCQKGWGTLLFRHATHLMKVLSQLKGCVPLDSPTSCVCVLEYMFFISVPLGSPAPFVCVLKYMFLICDYN